MKSATNLINGSYARTLGYYNKNDGGSATYKITNTQNNKIYIGQSIHIEQRWKEHLSGRGSKALYQDFYGKGNRTGRFQSDNSNG